MARHRKQTSPWRLWGGVAAGVLVLGAGGVYAAQNLGGAAGDGAAKPPSSTSTTTSSSTTPTQSPTTDQREAAAAAALQKCAESVAGQEAVARAAAASARDWGLHTDAQRRLDAGTFTVAQTKAQWADSKSRGAQDLAAFAAATADAKTTAGRCDGLNDVTQGTSVDANAQSCLARSAALTRVASTGSTVNAQWAAHITMMANKEHTDGAAYHTRWVGMVQASGPALAAYRTAAAAAAKVPACPA